MGSVLGSPAPLTYVGGPTALLEYGGLRLLTDPTFDPAGTEYPTPAYTLRKTQGPALEPDRVLPVDAVLLSHDHHVDNLDHAGRALLGQAARVLTSAAGAERLGGAAVGLAPWQRLDLDAASGAVRVTATPARHGPARGDRGPVIGLARAFSRATIVPLHFEGWEHFSEPRSRVEAAFAAAGLSGRLRWPPPGRAIEL